MHKKILSVLLVFVVVLSIVSIVGCDDASSDINDVVVYSEKKYPELNQHSAFLFVDGDGNIRPEETLTAKEFADALNALADGEGEFKVNISGGATVNYEQIITVLNRMFATESVTAAFGDAAQNAVLRGEFADFMCALLGRGGAEKVTGVSKNIPADLKVETEYANALLEASVAHTVSADGTVWETVDLPSSMAPGFNNVDGWLYYVGDDGRLLRNGTVGLLNFGADGRYTTGDKELDTTVSGVLETIIAENPDLDKIGLLRKAFEYSRDEFKYRRRFDAEGNHDVYAVGETGWEITDAKNMFNDKAGNCYCFAAVFWALARGLGYDARAISGTCLQDYQPHGWVIIEMDGEDYIFDPEWEWAYRNERDIYDKDMFKIPLDKATWWNYKWDKSQ